MKRILFTLWFPLLFSTFSHAQIDCLSTTKQLKESYDHKEYGPVACTCPCDGYKAQGLYTTDRNQCLKCLHYHYPQPFIYMKQTAKALPTPLLNKWYKAPQRFMASLIAKYRTKQYAQTPSVSS